MKDFLKEIPTSELRDWIAQLDREDARQSDYTIERLNPEEPLGTSSAFKVNVDQEGEKIVRAVMRRQIEDEIDRRLMVDRDQTKTKSLVKAAKAFAEINKKHKDALAEINRLKGRLDKLTRHNQELLKKRSQLEILLTSATEPFE